MAKGKHKMPVQSTDGHTPHIVAQQQMVQSSWHGALENMMIEVLGFLFILSLIGTGWYITRKQP